MLRHSRPSDDHEVGELLAQAFVDNYSRELPDVVITEQRFKELRDTARRRELATVLVVESGGRILGTTTLYRPGTLGSKAWLPDAAEMRFMAVAAEAQGKGIAQALLEESKRVARDELGSRFISLHVRREALGVARFYKNAGWQRRPEGDRDLLPEIFLEAYLLEL